MIERLFGPDGALADPTRLVWIAPALFALHVLEEAPGFVRWANELVDPDISTELFLGVNSVGMVVTLLLAALLHGSDSSPAALLAVAWLAFMMGANAVIHLTATVVHGSYAPGVVTATLLYIPYFLLFVRSVARVYHPPVALLALAMVVGAAPMLVHGYLIVFRGGRLF